MVEKLSVYVGLKTKDQNIPNGIEFIVWDSRSAYRLIIIRNGGEQVNIEPGKVYELHNVRVRKVDAHTSHFFNYFHESLFF